MLQTDPALRPESADAFADSLERCADEHAATDPIVPTSSARARLGVEFVAMVLPEGSLSSPDELVFISELALRGTASLPSRGRRRDRRAPSRSGSGESANLVDAIVRGFRERYGEIIVARERLDLGDDPLTERSVSDAAGRLAQRLSPPPPGKPEP